MAGSTKNLCAQIPVELHDRLRAEQERSGMTLSVYMTDLLTRYYEKGSEKTVEGMRTMAFQIPEEMFQRLKKHLERESQRTGRKVRMCCPAQNMLFSQIFMLPERLIQKKFLPWI